jgi:sulfite reductase (ferredoxin)
MKKETKAQRVERIKIEKDGLDVLKDIHRYAETGETVEAEDIDRFKWYGLYTQNRNLQDESDPTLYFMLRVKLPNGELNLKQLNALAAISQEYARGSADFTTRQDLQFHFIAVKDLPTIFAILRFVGLSSVFAAGDVPRNVVTCPLNGIDHQQITNVKGLVKEVNSYFDGNKALSNLPRKYKVGISGCHKHCTSHEIQDLSFSAVRTDEGSILFDVSVGGGLASNKRIASHLGYVTPSQVLPVVKAVTDIYKHHGNRESRVKARLGHIVEEWGVERFTDVLHEQLDFVLLPKKVHAYTPYEKREHFGIHESLVEGQSYIGCALGSRSIGASGLYSLIEIFKKYGGTTIRATTTQNFVITDAPTFNAQAISDALKAIGIDTDPSPFKARTQACTGMKFCKFAVAETKDLAQALIGHLEKRFPDFDEPISLSLNGCPNACAHAHIVDIGLIGCKVRHNSETVPGFELILGGHLEGDKSCFGQKSGIKFASKETLSVIEALIADYIKSGYATFRAFAAGKSNA